MTQSPSRAATSKVPEADSPLNSPEISAPDDHRSHASGLGRGRQVKVTRFVIATSPPAVGRVKDCTAVPSPSATWETNSMKVMTNELLMTLPEVARQLEVTLDEALKLIESGRLPAGRGADGGLYVRRGDLDSYRAAEATT